MSDNLNDPVVAVRRGHDEHACIDVLVRTYASGAETVAFRGGKDDTTSGWSPEILVVAVRAPLSHGDEPWIPVLP